MSLQRGRRHAASWRPATAAWAIALAVFATLLSIGHPRPADAATMHVCDYYASAATPCVAAHSTTRALFGQYNGPLYAVQRKSDGQSMNIGLLAPGDYANAAAQDNFCLNTTCTITIIYDQSPYHNDLTIEGPGHAGGQDSGVPADALPTTAGGHQVYGLSFSGSMGYRNDHTSGVAVNGQPETMYMVTSGTHVNDLCCFDYGNAEVNNYDNGNGHMDTVNFSILKCQYGGGSTTMPWVRSDMENGVYSSSTGCATSANDPVQPEPYVTALVKNNGQNFFSLKYANAQTSPTMNIGYAGPEPTVKTGYSPMHQEGAIVMGTGGDNSNGSIGSFFEGVMTAGLSSDTADNQVEADIMAVGYGGQTAMAGALQPGNEISLMTSAPNASTYLAHQGQTSATQTAVTTAVGKYGAADLRAAATWIVRRGFANNACLSFEARDMPGAFLRHAGDTLVVVPDDGSAGFLADSTFCPVAGLSGGGSSFQAPDAPGKYIRVYGSRAVIASDGGAAAYDRAATWKKDVSWVVTQPLSP